MTLLHFNHGWRGEASDRDEAWVGKLAQRLGVGFESARASQVPNRGGRSGESWEEIARTERKRFFQEKAAFFGANVLTAHQGDDLAETLLWRLFTGAAHTHGGGILWQDGPEIRPLLSVRRAELRAFLREEKIAWREDSTNQDPRFMRARMRQEIVPPIEALFPRAIPHLVELALRTQKSSGVERDNIPIGAIFGQTGARIRRAHWESASRAAAEPAVSEKNPKITLPGDWLLERESGDRWILSRNDKSTV